MPMAGAPRTASDRMASTTASTVDSRQWTRVPGSRRWSMMTAAPPSHVTAASASGRSPADASDVGMGGGLATMGRDNG